MSFHPTKAAFLSLIVAALSTGIVWATPPAVILDVDIDSDVDDVGALAIAHALANRGEITLLALVVTSDDPYAPVCASALNQFFGRADLPIGFLKGQGQLKNHSRYTRQIAAEFPHALASHESAADSTVVYRRALAAAADDSVVIVTIGHLSSLQRLLESRGDAVSGQSGVELVTHKVRRWVCMGGAFPRGKEANFYRPDPNSTVVCLRDWPKPATFCGWELGNPIKTGGPYLKARLDASHPVYRAYELYNQFSGRASWDQVAILMLRDDADRYFVRVGGGHCHVESDGSNEWRTDHVRPHEYVALRDGVAPNDVARLIDDLVPSVSQRR